MSNFFNECLILEWNPHSLSKCSYFIIIENVLSSDCLWDMSTTCVSYECRLGNLSHSYPRKNWLQLFYIELSQSLQRSGPDLYPVVKLLKKSIQSVTPILCRDKLVYWLCYSTFSPQLLFSVICSLVIAGQEICWGGGKGFSSRYLTTK